MLGGFDLTHPLSVPDKPALEGLEQKWMARWDALGTYRFDRTRPRDEVFSIDTPPPTVSGSLHVGHVFSYTHTDVIARFQRMRGKAVFYPMGWDDNGLPTERRAELFASAATLRALLSLVRPPRSPAKPRFRCRGPLRAVREADVKTKVFEYLGVSRPSLTVETYAQSPARSAYRTAFLARCGRQLSTRGSDARDIDFRTASPRRSSRIARSRGLSRIRFFRFADAGAPPVRRRQLEIDTTAGLIPACVALAPPGRNVRPTSARVETPLFGVHLPINFDPLADPEKDPASR